MQKRNLGTLEVSALGLGCMGMSMGYGKSDDDQSIKTIHHAIDNGITFLDTSDIYGNGHNEELICRALKDRSREKIVLATKCGFIRLGKIDGSPEHIKNSCDASLKRLGVDVIDLFYLHRADKNIPIEESMGAFSDLIAAGKIRHIGLSEVTPKTLKRAAKIHSITALQSEYSLWHRKPELEILKTCRELNIGFVPYSPLGRGFLTGTIRDTSALEQDDFRKKILPRFQADNLKSNLQIADNIKIVANNCKCTPAQLALAWLLAQGNDIVPIPGTRLIKRLDENMHSIDVKLSADELAEINRLIPMNSAAGAQYPEEHNLEV